MIHPVILSGGAGTRLWPLSRKDYPKQFSPLIGRKSLFETTLERVQGADFQPPLVISNVDLRFIAAKQIDDMGVTGAELILEPFARNTGPAVLTAALRLAAQHGPEALMLVLPSDHLVQDVPAFRAAVADGAPAAEAGKLVTFGVSPDRAETGYGWLESAATVGGGASPVTRFVEKPDATNAQSMLQSGGFLWNAGIFLFRARNIIAAYETHAPSLMTPCQQALDGAQPDLDFIRLSEDYGEASDISIDYAVMERAEEVSAVALDCGWSDLGSWEGVWRAQLSEQTPQTASENGADGTVITGGAVQIGCRDTLLRREEDAPELVGLNLEDIAVVATRDAVLVSDLRDSQAVKTAVAYLREHGAPAADVSRRVHRPWGWYEGIAAGQRFQVKQIFVPPGGKLSLQSHLHRSEHWIVVSGTARVQIENDVHLVSENQSVYVPLGARHRLENPGRVDLRLIEVQTGAYLGEDDIERYDDVYARV